MQPNQPAGVTTIQNGADFRRARLAARAALANNVNAFMQFDFAFPGRPTFTDVWVEWTDLPVLGTVRVGQWKQPFSLEVVSSFRYTTFMERSSLFQAFTPFRHIGIGAYNHADDLMGTWAASYLRTGQDQFGGSLSTRGGNGFTGRMTRLAWYDESDGRSYLHLGGDYYFNSPPQHTIAFRTIPEIFVGQNANNGTGTAGFAVPGNFDGTPFFANTGNVTNVTGVNTFDLEGLWVYGPLSLQSEAMAAQVNRTGDPGSLLHGEYVQVGWFLTGEHRPYDRIAGAIDRVRPFEDFFLARTGDGLARGKGAWEVAIRYSHLDLNDKTISGGILNDVTFGVNWYTNPYAKIVFNFIHMWRQSPTSPPSPAGNGPAVAVKSEANAFGLMAQADF
jgi:phosphate-selective porin OprO/OprP